MENQLHHGSMHLRGNPNQAQNAIERIKVGCALYRKIMLAFFPNFGHTERIKIHLIGLSESPGPLNMFLIVPEVRA